MFGLNIVICLYYYFSFTPLWVWVHFNDCLNDYTGLWTKITALMYHEWESWEQHLWVEILKADQEFFFQFSAGSTFHRCINAGQTAALYGGKGTRWLGSFSSSLAAEEPRVLFGASKIKSSSRHQRKDREQGRKKFYSFQQQSPQSGCCTTLIHSIKRRK